MAIDWGRGYSAEWRAYEVDRGTWADGQQAWDVESASVERTVDGDAPLLEAGSMSAVVPVGETWRERYIRLAMVARQGGEVERVDLCTLLVAAARGNVNRSRDALELTGRSVLWPASTTKCLPGDYAPALVDGAQWAARALRRCVAAPVVVDASFRLSDHTVFPNGTSVLRAVWMVLDAGGCSMRLSGDGTIAICEPPSEPALVLDQSAARLLHPDMPHDLDWSDVPNRYVAHDGTDVAIATNDDPDSAVSTASRGYFVDELDTKPALVGGESLQAYAQRRLAERSVVADVRTYTREFWPDVVPGDLVRASIASVGLDGDMRVTRQSLDCGAGVTVTEEASMEVSLWTE